MSFRDGPWLRALLRPRPFSLPAAALLLVGLVGAAIPLLQAIEYPLSLVAAPVAALAFGFAGAWHARRAPVLVLLKAGSLAAAAATVALVLPPGLVSLYAGRVCEPLYGLLFILLGPLAAALCGLVAGLALGRLGGRRWGLPGVALLFAATIAVAVAEFFYTPGVRFYGSFFGLYHGAVYDEAVFVEGPYAWLRVFDAALCGAVVLFLWYRDSRRPRVAGAAAALGVAAVVLALLGPRLGFVQTGARLEAALAGRYESAHFVVRYTPGGKAEAFAPLVAGDLEFRAAQLGQRFALPSSDAPITTWLYEDALQKQALMGAGRTSIAKPWLRQVHVHTREVGGRLLAHELAHVMLGRLTDAVLRLPTGPLGIPRPGIMEGGAVAAEPGSGLLTTHQWARAMRDIGRQPDMAAILEGLAFWRQSSTLAYTACGSFVRYLLETRGTAAYAALYGGADFATAYGEELPALLAAWNAWLDEVPLRDEDLALAEFVFTRPAVFDKVCPYAGGRCLRRVVEAIRSAQPPERAVRLGRRAMHFTDFDLRLGQTLVRLLRAAGAVEESVGLLATLQELYGDRVALPARQALRLAQADGDFLLGEDGLAAVAYARLEESPFARWVAPGLEMRRALLREGAPSALRRLALGAHARDELPELLAELVPAVEGLGPVGRVQVAFGLAHRPETFGDAAALLTRVLADEEAPVGTIGFAAGFARARLLVFVGRLEEARAALTDLRPDSPAQRAAVEDWLERVEWRAQGAASGM